MLRSGSGCSSYLSTIPKSRFYSHLTREGDPELITSRNRVVVTLDRNGAQGSCQGPYEDHGCGYPDRNQELEASDEVES